MSSSQTPLPRPAAPATPSGAAVASGPGRPDGSVLTRSACPYCGVGCGLVAETRGGALEAVHGDEGSPVNRGRLCQKPLGLPASSRSSDRATEPLWRTGRDERLRPTGWDEVMPWLAGRLAAIQAEHGRDAIAFYISGQLLTEDYYVVNKLAKGFLGTNNVDSNSRLCMSSAVAGYTGSFGADGPPPAYEDIEQADCFLLLGSNAAACHPILWGRVRARQAEGARVIVADPRRTDTAAAADLHLPVRPGTDLALLNAMLCVIDREGLADRAFLAAHADGVEEMLRVAREWTPERAAETCGVPAADIERAARLFAGAGGAMALWSMGANQSRVGTLKNRALNNLCLMTGQIGRPGAGPLSLTGQPNAMGGRETGGLAHLLPGYRAIASAEHRTEMARLWGLPPGAAGISPEPGLPATDLFEALEDGRVKAVWICATNPAVSMPDSARVRAALAKAQLVVCQDAYHPTETSSLAHVVLPAAQWPEKEGTMTNSERRVSLVRKAIDPPGTALPDWQIFARLGAELGFGEHFGWETAAEVFDEFARTTAGRPCDQSGISHARLLRAGGVQWPCPATDPGEPEHPGTVRLYEGGGYPTADGRAQLAPTPHAPPAERTGPRFPITLTTGRVASQWHTMTRTGKSARLVAAEPEPFVELSAADAERAGVRDGERARLVARRGEATMRARVVDGMPAGTAFAPFHWGALHAPAGAGQLNATTHGVTDPVSRQPELKACAVRVEPAAAPAGGRSRRRGRPTARPQKVVVVGAGMAGLAAAEAVLANGAPGAWQATLVGREPEGPYNRMQLSHALAGDVDAGALAMRAPRWYAQRPIEVRSGSEVTELDLAGRELVTADGARTGYDALVLATGSRPLLPPIGGLDRKGVHAFRTVEDARSITQAAGAARRAAVIGGGLLGLEAAAGLRRLGLPVTVVHLADRLMETQLDGAGAAVLERRLHALGIDVLRERTTVEVLGEHRAEGLRFSDGDELAADLVVVAAGIRPEVELARRAGLEVGRGVLVDDELRTSAPGVWAVGECAEHRGAVHGLWEPARAQARAAGASIAGGPASFTGHVPAVRLKIAGVDLFCAGRQSAAGHDEDEIVALDTRSGGYRKLVLAGRRLRGAILIGDLRLADRLTALVRSGERVPDDLLDIAGVPERTDAEDDPLVCSCNAIRRAEVLAAVGERGLRRVEDVAQFTGAGTGCGGCAPAIRELIATVAGRGRRAADR